MKNEDFYWDIIKEIGWEMKRTDYRNIGHELGKKYDKHIRTELQLFIRKKYFNMRDKLQHLWFSNNGDRLGLGDDSYWDFCINLVGLGKEIYNAVCNRPNIAVSMAHMGAYTENFGYIFHHTSTLKTKYICKLEKK